MDRDDFKQRLATLMRIMDDYIDRQSGGGLNGFGLNRAAPVPVRSHTATAPAKQDPQPVTQVRFRNRL